MAKTLLQKWRVERSRALVKNRWLKLRKDVCALPGKKGRQDYYVLELPHYCMVVAQREDGRLLLVREYKHAVGEVILQLPAGLVDKGESPRQAALRELEEETGYRAGKLEAMGQFFSAPGRLNNRMHLFFASQLQHTGKQNWDSTENLEVLALSPAQCRRLIRGGQLRDQASVLGLLLSW